jgi:hypothetical protein
MSIRTQNQKILIWILMTEAMLIISTRLGAFLHEFVGHGLVALLFGGRFEAFSLTLFAGGEALFSGNFSEIAKLGVSLGGIAVNLMSGLTVLWFIRRYRPSFSFTLFGLVFAGASVLSQLQYLILGSYYRHGDPVSLTPYPIALWLAWAGGLLALAFSSLYLMRLFFQLQDAYFPVSPLFTRALISLLILGIPVALYAGLYHYSRTDLVSTAAIQEARHRVYQEAEKIKTETGSEQSVAKIAEELTPHPILPWILAAYVITTIMAFFSPARVRKEKSPPPFPSSLFPTLLWLIIAGASLVLIALTW